MPVVERFRALVTGVHGRFVLLTLLLLGSSVSSRYLPFLKPWGADLYNVLAYQQCSAETSPYLIPASVCGDLWGRDMVYPPLLFHSFFWLRSLTHAEAIAIWAPSSMLMLAAAMWIWAGLDARGRVGRSNWMTVVFGLLLLLQYPSVFSFERGGTDAVPVVLFTVAAVLILRCRPGWGGVFLGLATAYKLYPLFAAATIMLGLLARQRDDGAARSLAWLTCGTTAAVSFVVSQAVFFRDAQIYYRSVLPEFVRLQASGQSVYAHALPAYFGHYAWIVFGVLLILWALAVRRAVATEDAPIALAGGLAVCTYVQQVSWDYNLVTTYPLLVLLFLRAQRTDRWGLLLLGLVSVVGDRRLFEDSQGLLGPQAHVMLQVLFLALTAMALAWPSGMSRGRGSETVGT